MLVAAMPFCNFANILAEINDDDVVFFILGEHLFSGSYMFNYYYIKVHFHFEFYSHSEICSIAMCSHHLDI